MRFPSLCEMRTLTVILAGVLLPSLACAPSHERDGQETPVRIRDKAEQLRPIHKVDPTYPPAAVKGEIEGTVEFEAVINRDGAVKYLRVVGGHPLLVRAALDVLPQWRFAPTLLHGQPVEVTTPITIEFRLPPPKRD